MTEREIIKSLFKSQITTPLIRGWRMYFRLEGHTWHEVDYFTISKSGFFTEHEIKLTKSDFMADKKKKKYRSIENGSEKWVANRFYYVVPESIKDDVADHLPKWAGLISMRVGTLYPETIKKSPIIHRKKMDISSDAMQIMTKMSLRAFKAIDSGQWWE